MSEKLPPDEAWNALERMVLEDEAERVGKLSDAELDRELAAKGIDPAAADAQADALLARLEARKAAPAGGSVVALPPKRSPPARAPSNVVRLLPWMAAAALAAAILFFLAQPRTPGEPIARGTSSPSAPPTPLQLAATLRDQAIIACDEGRWVDCRDRLLQASRLDPAGDAEPRIAALRERAQKALDDDARKYNAK